MFDHYIYCDIVFMYISCKERISIYLNTHLFFVRFYTFEQQDRFVLTVTCNKNTRGINPGTN